MGSRASTASAPRRISSPSIVCLRHDDAVERALIDQPHGHPGQTSVTLLRLLLHVLSEVDHPLQCVALAVELFFHLVPLVLHVLPGLAELFVDRHQLLDVHLREVCLGQANVQGVVHCFGHWSLPSLMVAARLATTVSSCERKRATFSGGAPLASASSMFELTFRAMAIMAVVNV